MRSVFLSLLTFISGQACLFSQDLTILLDEANEKAQNGNCIGAISSYDSILSLKPDFSNAFVLKGLCYSMLEKTDSACICFIEGIDRDNPYAKDYYLKYCNTFQPAINSEDIRTGRFTYLSYIQDTLSYIQRDANIQTEFSGDSKLKSDFKIKWDSPSAYSLKLVETNDPALSFLNKNSLIKINILKVSGTSYLYHYSLDENSGFGKLVKQ